MSNENYTLLNNNQNKNQYFKIFYYISVSMITIYEYNWLNIVFPNIPFYKNILFLTIFSLFCNLFFYIIKSLMHFKDNILSGNQEKNFFRFIFCLSFLVFVLYWGMILSNRDGVIPQGVFIPPILDFLIHGGNFLINLFTHTIILGKNEENLNYSWRFHFFISLFYTTFYKIIYFVFDYSVYPIIAIMDIKLYIFLNFVGINLLILGEYLFFKGLKIRNKEILLKIN
jgi:hypothetical protein